jgi:hypothetical protein
MSFLSSSAPSNSPTVSSENSGKKSKKFPLTLPIMAEFLQFQSVRSVCVRQQAMVARLPGSPDAPGVGPAAAPACYDPSAQKTLLPFPDTLLLLRII